MITYQPGIIWLTHDSLYEIEITLQKKKVKKYIIKLKA
jgi:hypothetical protein